MEVAKAGPTTSPQRSGTEVRGAYYLLWQAYQKNSAPRLGTDTNVHQDEARPR